MCHLLSSRRLLQRPRGMHLRWPRSRGCAPIPLAPLVPFCRCWTCWTCWKWPVISNNILFSSLRLESLGFGRCAQLIQWPIRSVAVAAKRSGLAPRSDSHFCSAERRHCGSNAPVVHVKSWGSDCSQCAPGWYPARVCNVKSSGSYKVGRSITCA